MLIEKREQLQRKARRIQEKIEQDRLKRIDEENPIKSRTAKEIAEASISSLTDIEMSDREEQELEALVERTKEGGINLDEQS